LGGAGAVAVNQDVLELLKLGVAALTPIMTGIVGVVILRLGKRMEINQQLHNELFRKRLALFEDIAPKLNDIHCFYQSIGHWTELTPEDIIRRKRAVDRSIQVNRYLFRLDFWQAYQDFEQAHFEMFSAPGQPARLRLDVDHVRKLTGDLFKPEWLTFASAKHGDSAEQQRNYQALMSLLGKEVRGA
jgi:hypothetical protein